MAVGRAAGYPDYTSSGDSQFIPEIWSGKLLEKFYTATTFAAISNTDYVGEISDVGDKVIIRTVPDVTINTYTKGQKLTYENLESDPIEMTIDYGKYYAFTIDDIDAYQSDIALMDSWANDASQQMKITIDAHLYSLTYDDASAYNKGTTAGYRSSGFNLGTLTSAVQLTKANILEYIVDCGTVLTEYNIPEDGRWIVLPAWATGLIIKSDLKDVSMTGDSASPIRNGYIGKIRNFDIYESNQLYSVSDSGYTGYYVPFGHRSAISFASQITKSESLRAESTFGDLVRGLNVYGVKTLQPTALGCLYCKK